MTSFSDMRCTSRFIGTTGMRPRPAARCRCAGGSITSGIGIDRLAGDADPTLGAGLAAPRAAAAAAALRCEATVLTETPALRPGGLPRPEPLPLPLSAAMERSVAAACARCCSVSLRVFGCEQLHACSWQPHDAVHWCMQGMVMTGRAAHLLEKHLATPGPRLLPQGWPLQLPKAVRLQALLLAAADVDEHGLVLQPPLLTQNAPGGNKGAARGSTCCREPLALPHRPACSVQ